MQVWSGSGVIILRVWSKVCTLKWLQNIPSGSVSMHHSILDDILDSLSSCEL